MKKYYEAQLIKRMEQERLGEVLAIMAEIVHRDLTRTGSTCDISPARKIVSSWQAMFALKHDESAEGTISQ